MDEFSIRFPAGKPGTGTVRHHEYVPREDAIRDIAAHVGDRDAFLVSVPPGALAVVTSRLRRLPGATCYIDCGGPAGVARVRSPHLPEAAAMAKSQPPGTACAVFVVPKAIPAAKLSRLLGHEIPADGSQDLVVLQTRDLFDMPALLVDAIGRHDPKFAAEMYANDTRNQS